MAYAMIGGIVAATFLTLLFLPALYVGWFRIRETDSRSGGHNGEVRGPAAAVLANE
jgi:hypothetical protein